MKVLLTGIGSAGDVFPVIGLGLRLKAHGHQVVIIASAHFAPLAERLGLPFAGIGTDQWYRSIVDDPDLFHPTRGFGTAVRYVMTCVEPVEEVLRREVVPGRTVVGAHIFDFASRFLQEQTGLPVATLLYQPSLLRSLHQVPTLTGTTNLSGLPRWAKRLAWWGSDRFYIDPALSPPLNRLRVARGLRPVARPFDRWVLSPLLAIGLFPAWFAPPQPDWPPQLRLTSFPLWDAAEPMPPSLDAFLEGAEPPILVTLGSAMAHGREYLQVAVEASQLLGRRCVMLSRFSDMPTDLPAGVRYFEFAPLSQVLPRCAAVVHHGGIGTTAAALAAGVPQVIMPMSHDQPDNAARVRRLGVGETLLPARFEPRRLASALDCLLVSRSVANRCAALSNEVQQVDGLGQASKLLETLVA